MAPSPSRTFDSLPPELLLFVLPYLSGFDLLTLSHVDKRFFTDLLGPQSKLWRSRVPRAMRWAPHRWHLLAKGGWLRYLGVGDSFEVPTPTSPPKFTAKRDYVSCVSMRFPGNLDAYSAVSPRSNVWAGNNASFSFDVWLALLPAGFDLGPMNHSRGVYIPPDAVGGILLGAQSRFITSRDMSEAAAQFAHVDPHGNLYCSFIAGNKPALATLELHRWYHLALTVDKTSPEAANSHQCVYLDGKLVDARQGSLPAFASLEYAQIGNGVMDVGSVGNLRAGYRGKYGFNGLVDEFRLWRGALSEEEVRHLKRGDEASVRDSVKCTWSLMRDGESFHFYGNLSAVRCTRPMEGACQSIRFAYCVIGGDDPCRIHVDRF